MTVESDSGMIRRWLLGSYLVVAAAILITCYLEDATKIQIPTKHTKRCVDGWMVLSERFRKIDGKKSGQPVDIVNIALFAGFHTCWGRISGEEIPFRSFLAWWATSFSWRSSDSGRQFFRWSLFRIYQNRYKLCGIAQKRNQQINLRTSVFLVWEVPTFYHRSMGLVVCTLYVCHRLSWNNQPGRQWTSLHIGPGFVRGEPTRIIWGKWFGWG